MQFNREAYVQLTGMTPDHFGYLTRNGVIRPLEKAGRGVPRVFGTEDVMLGGVIMEIHKSGMKIGFFRQLAENVYTMIEAGRRCPLEHRLLPEVLNEALLTSDDRCGQLAEAIVDLDTGLQRVTTSYDELLANRTLRGEGPDPRVVEYARKVSIEEAANLNGYFHFTNPAYLAADPPHIVWDLADDGDGYQLVERAADQPGLLADGIFASCISVSLTAIARRLWRAQEPGGECTDAAGERP